MEHTKSTGAQSTAEAVNPEIPQPKLTLEILIARMIQTQRDIQAYRRGEMTKEEFDALGIKFF